MQDQNTQLSDRTKVNLWLDAIDEHDPACRAEVMEQCASDKDARRYFVGRYRQDCAS
jgi:hypothetical protein